MKSFWKNKKVLVTGGTGFVGSYVAKILAEKGADVTVTTSNTKNNKNTFKHGKVKIADLTNLQDCLIATKDQEIVFHFAALDGGVSFKKTHPAEMFRANVGMTVNVVEACKENGVERVLLMSSIDIYPKATRSPFQEKYGYRHTTVDDLTGYAWAKLVGEITGSLYKSEYNLQIAIIRAGNIYGPGDYIETERARVIPSFISQALQNKDIHIIGNGDQERSFLYISDFAQAALNAAEFYAIGDPVNVSGTNYISIKRLAEMIIGQVKSSSKIILEKKDMSLPKDRTISVTKAKKKLRFKEHVSLDEGLAETIASLKTYYEKTK